MSFVSRLEYHLGRTLLGLILIAMGFFMFQQGHPFYNKYVHAFRKMLLPDSQASQQALGLGLTYEQLN